MRQLECHEEKIHLCGKIQSFGFLCIFDESGCIAASENLTIVLDIPMKEILGRSIAQLLPLLSSEKELNLKEIETQIRGEIFTRFVERIRIKNVDYYLSIYQYDERTYLEIEICNENHLKATRLFYYAKYLEERHGNAWQSLTVLIRQIIGFDRVMVYRFEEDNSGQVIAESIADGMTPLMGYRYPEFDIPAQARELYVKFLARHVADVDGPTIAIQGLEAAEVDLTRCSLRALSPVHLQYLKNAGARASASFSIVIEGKLWGLVACQNSEPLNVDLAQRHLCAFLTQYAINYYLSEHQKENLVAQTIMGVMERDLKSELLVNSDIGIVLERFAPQILEIAGADGLMIKHDRGSKSWGDVPTELQLREIDRFIEEEGQNDLFFTSNFVYGDSAPPQPVILPGILRINILPSNKWHIYLFRREHVYEDVWAGKPEKIYHYDPEKKVEFPSPRTSFEAWREKMKGKSIQWKRAELSFMEKVAQITQQAIAQRGGEIAQLNKELVRSNNALDTFGYTLTHDLKNPLSSIKLAAQMMLMKDDLPKDMLRKMALNIMDATALITEMMDKVYQLTQSNYVAFKTELIDPRNKILNILESCKQQFESAHLEFVLGETLPILGERTLLYQLFLNLISNAIKYSSKKDRPRVEVYSEKQGHFVNYYIKDNGIGMDIKDDSNIFDIFKRLPNSQGFEGSGIGLSIVKRLVDRLEAKVTVDSELNIGTTFCITFKV
ncbi:MULTISPECIES: ATP-binding protein [Sphingobacterium]|jgi:light-regulated signal transduction histidine kinase (bacteriophytochrome)|uniref:histidine kinase n=3 Tax=Sphingobacterium multivorum TaxID=28454 RepID=A0A654DGR1_SPHMU|nr:MULTISPECIES: ATP-binding protein [Sphingobacterium]HBI90163.1 histidine kinase [Sphingobacterium sp.]QQT45632.1 GAF domain-containing protein [Sphingobacterium multivorum]QQT61721.1 GAF domain-containing protein [Sphingobacterium multivorum]SUJ27657.1 Phytochrome-like protein cph1 [Sphingobacterium multivorum]VXD05165.1 Phytochrome-like protein cph1 [Sphingobacterium multivorum]